MDLYLIRHAEAQPRENGSDADDWSRPLTETGHQQARHLGAVLQRLGVRLDLIVTSPLVRARQTVDGLLPLLAEPRPAVETFDEIGDAVRPKRVARYLERCGHASVALVGHQPGLGRFLAWLVGSKKARVELDKAGLARVQCDSWSKGGGALAWLVTPEWF